MVSPNELRKQIKGDEKEVVKQGKRLAEEGVHSELVAESSAYQQGTVEKARGYEGETEGEHDSKQGRVQGSKEVTKAELTEEELKEKEMKERAIKESLVRTDEFKKGLERTQEAREKQPKTPEELEQEQQRAEEKIDLETKKHEKKQVANEIEKGQEKAVLHGGATRESMKAEEEEKAKTGGLKPDATPPVDSPESKEGHKR